MLIMYNVKSPEEVHVWLNAVWKLYNRSDSAHFLYCNRIIVIVYTIQLWDLSYRGYIQCMLSHHGYHKLINNYAY